MRLSLSIVAPSCLSVSCDREVASRVSRATPAPFDVDRRRRQSISGGSRLAGCFQSYELQFAILIHPDFFSVRSLIFRLSTRVFVFILSRSLVRFVRRSLVIRISITIVILVWVQHALKSLIHFRFVVQDEFNP